MTPRLAGTLVFCVAALLAGGPASAQNAAALAKAAARSADAFDSLVTPGALRALRRMTDSAAAERVEMPPAPSPANRTAAARTRATPPARQPEQAVAEEQPASPAPLPPADTTKPITAIAARLVDGAVELRVVAAGRPAPALSEPFRAGQHSRLFLTFQDATLALAEPPAVGDAGALLAGVDIAERDGGVRIALDLTALDRYALRAAGDTAILWLAQPPPAAEVSRPVAPAAAGPDDIALAREAALAGWAAFRRDVAAAAHAVAAFGARAGTAVGGGATATWTGAARTAARATGWVTATVPFAGLARAAALIALLLAPPLVALRLLRRRQAIAARPRAAEIVGLGAVAAGPKPETEPGQPTAKMKEVKQPKPAKQPKGKKPAVTRTTADARLWAARTLAANGADVGEIARQTGLSREAAILLVRRAQKQ